MRKKNNTETSLWISNTDLISGMLVIFLFLAVILIQQSNDQRNKIAAITDESYQAEQQLRKNIQEAFTQEEIKKYHLDSEEAGYAYFSDDDNKFAQGKAEILPGFYSDLSNFLPKYLSAIAKCDPERIKEIRIEGHTSSEWSDNVDPNLAYFNNMELSQARTRAIISMAFGMTELVPYQNMLKTKVTANGLSSSHIITKKDNNGNLVEDSDASRRIEFRVVANDKSTVEQIRKVMNVE